MDDKSAMSMEFSKGKREVWGHLKIISSLGNEANEENHVYVFMEHEGGRSRVCGCVFKVEHLCRDSLGNGTLREGEKRMWNLLKVLFHSSSSWALRFLLLLLNYCILRNYYWNRCLCCLHCIIYPLVTATAVTRQQKTSNDCYREKLVFLEKQSMDRVDSLNTFKYFRLSSHVVHNYCYRIKGPEQKIWLPWIWTQGLWRGPESFSHTHTTAQSGPDSPLEPGAPAALVGTLPGLPVWFRWHLPL